MEAYEPIESLPDAHANARRRVDELRGRTPDGSVGAATLLHDAEGRMRELCHTVEQVASLLPTRVEAAVGRALADADEALARRVDAASGGSRELVATVARMERELLAERVGRVEDLEVVVELLASGMAALRRDVDRLATGLSELGQRLDEPVRVTLERPRVGGVHELFTPTDPESANGAQPGRHG